MAKIAALILAGALIPGPIPAYEVQGNTITVTAEEMQHCAAEGGCRLVTKDWLDAQVRRSAERLCRGV